MKKGIEKLSVMRALAAKIRMSLNELISCSLKTFWRAIMDNKGVSGVFVAISIVPIIGIIGMATDVSRAYIVKQRLGTALDAATLAGGRNFFEDDRSEQIQKYFEANFPTGFMGATVEGPFELSADGERLASDHVYDPSDTVLRLTARANIDTLFMRIFGNKDMSVPVSSEVTRETVLLDVVMALDVSGSMNTEDVGGGSRIEAAKTAADDLVDILFGDNDTNSLLKIGLVPWSGSVNITQSGTRYGFEKTSSDPDVWAAIPEDEKFTTSPVIGSPDNPYEVQYYRYDPGAVTYNSSKKWYELRDWNATGNSNSTFVLKNYSSKIDDVYYAHNAPDVPLLAEPEDDWNGCVYARYARQTEWDVDEKETWNDTDAIADAADIYDGPVTVNGVSWPGWYPMGDETHGSRCEMSVLNGEWSWRDDGYYRNYKCTTCPRYGITPLQSQKKVIVDAIEDIEISGGSYYTNIPIGLAWAWRTLSPGQPFNQATVLPENTNFTQARAIILLTDGANTRRGADAYNKAITDRDSRLKKVAANIKDDDIIIYTIQFAQSSGSLGDLLTEVASSNKHYFFAPDKESLQLVFKQIANELSNLRLSR